LFDFFFFSYYFFILPARDNRNGGFFSHMADSYLKINTRRTETARREKRKERASSAIRLPRCTKLSVGREKKNYFNDPTELRVLDLRTYIRDF